MFTPGDYITLDRNGVLTFPRLAARNLESHSNVFPGCRVDPQLIMVFSWILRNELDYDTTALSSFEDTGFALRINKPFEPRFGDFPEQSLRIGRDQLGFLAAYGEHRHCHFDFVLGKCPCSPELKDDLLHYVDTDHVGLQVLTAILGEIIGVSMTLARCESYELRWTFVLPPDMYRPRAPKLIIGNRDP